MVLKLNLKGRVSRLVDEGCGKGIPGRGNSVKSSKYERKEQNQGVLEAGENCWNILNKGRNQVEK